MITQHSSIGFIGLGAMGRRMAQRLLNNDFKLIAYDHTSSKTRELVEAERLPLQVFANSR